jgi:hypothetical protein
MILLHEADTEFSEGQRNAHTKVFYLNRYLTLQL